jgi:ribonucleoside-diphosphate reductase beta chain
MTRLLTPSSCYKPFSYSWAHDLWLTQQQIHWLPDEVPMNDDLQDWSNNLTPAEKYFLTQIFRFFVQSDLDVETSYLNIYLKMIKNNEVRMMLTAFANMENIHQAAYAHLIDTLGMDETEYSTFLSIPSMQAKENFTKNINGLNTIDLAIALATFGAFIEGLQLFSSFAMLLNFPRQNKMKGMGQIITFSIRDESLHCQGIIQLYHALCAECNIAKSLIEPKILSNCMSAVALEDDFIDHAFSLGPIPNLTSNKMKQYIRYIADWRLKQLDMSPIFMIPSHPLPWLLEITNGVEHTNFFENRATEYSKAATRGKWEDVWKFFENKE